MKRRTSTIAFRLIQKRQRNQQETRHECDELKEDETTTMAAMKATPAAAAGAVYHDTVKS